VFRFIHTIQQVMKRGRPAGSGDRSNHISAPLWSPLLAPAAGTEQDSNHRSRGRRPAFSRCRLSFAPCFRWSAIRQKRR